MSLRNPDNSHQDEGFYRDADRLSAADDEECRQKLQLLLFFHGGRSASLGISRDPRFCWDLFTT